MQMLFHISLGYLKMKLSGFGVGAPDLSSWLQPHQPHEAEANVTFLKGLAANPQGRKVSPHAAEGIGSDTCPLKYELV